VPEADVDVERLGDGTVLDVNGLAVSWHEGRAFPSRRWVTADAAGRFRITGLAPGPHRLSTSGAPGLHLHPSLQSTEPFVVQVPQAGVRLDVRGRRLEIHVEHEGQPLDGVSVNVSARGGFMVIVTEEGVASVVVDPASPVTLRIDHRPYRAVSVEVPTDEESTEQRVRIELEAEDPRPRVVVRLRGEAARGITYAHFTWIRLGTYSGESAAGPPGAPQPAPPDLLSDHCSAAVEDGRCELTEVAAGQVRLVLHPNGSWLGADGSGYLIADEAVLALANGRTTEVEIEVRKGGRLRLAARDEEGTLLTPECTIRNAKGETIRASFLAAREGTSMSQPGRLGYLSASTVDPPLEPGTYTIELVAAGFAPWTGTAEVTLGKTTDVEARLQPPR
jgi:hypothetical protein